MLTGAGKTDVLMLVPYLIRKKRVLVVTPSKMVRGQIAEDFSDLRTLCVANVFNGNRIDLHVETIGHAQENIMNDSLCKLLLDKDNCLLEILPSSDKNYWIHKPTLEQYQCTCSGFWWCLNSVAKGLWREEIPYVQDMLNFVVRKQLEKMLSWKVGVMTNFSVSVGKSAKYMYKWLSEQEWKKYLQTYCGADVKAIWESVEII